MHEPRHQCTYGEISGFLIDSSLLLSPPMCFHIFLCPHSTWDAKRRPEESKEFATLVGVTAGKLATPGGENCPGIVEVPAHGVGVEGPAAWGAWGPGAAWSCTGTDQKAKNGDERKRFLAADGTAPRSNLSSRSSLRHRPLGLFGSGSRAAVMVPMAGDGWGELC